MRLAIRKVAALRAGKILGLSLGLTTGLSAFLASKMSKFTIDPTLFFACILASIVGFAVYAFCQTFLSLGQGASG